MRAIGELAVNSSHCHVDRLLETFQLYRAMSGFRGKAEDI